MMVTGEQYNKKKNGELGISIQQYHWVSPNLVFDNKQILHASCYSTIVSQTPSKECPSPTFDQITCIGSKVY